MRKLFIELCALLAVSAARLGIALAEENEPSQQLDEVVVSSTPLPKSIFELAQPVSVMSEEQVVTGSKSSLGETLATQPGVTATSFGNAASRPVIRGLGGDRIRVLQNGTGVQDASNTSPDHAVSTEPIEAKRIEIVRGPATLLFGPNAVGGIVNVIDNRIPEELPKKPVSGDLDLRTATADWLRSAAGEIEAPLGPFALHLDGFDRKSDNYKIPRFARTEDLRAQGSPPEGFEVEPKHRLPQSFSDANGGSIGVSYIFEKGFIGGAFNTFNTKYGTPNGEPHVYIDLKQRRYDLHGRVDDALPGFQRVEGKSTITHYNHTEFEGSTPGTTFKNDGVDSRLELTQESIGALDGVVGTEYQYSDFAAIGEEAFQPPSKTNTISGFVYEGYSLTDSLSLETGGRIDGNNVHTGAFQQGESDPHSLTVSPTTLSGAIGAVYKFLNGYGAALSISHTERAPSSGELFANGKHVATGAFEIGDPDLKTERSLGIDLNLRKRTGIVTGFVGGFYNRFDNYISLNPDGKKVEDLDEFVFQAVPADFWGSESQIAYHLFGPQTDSAPRTKAEEIVRGKDSDDGISTDRNHLDLIGQLDFVRAYEREGGGDLPRIPPWRLLLAADYKREVFGARLETVQVFRQGEVSEFETDTAAYNLVNLVLTYDLKTEELPPAGAEKTTIFVRADNIFDSEARNHISFIKDVAPLPGRNISAGLRVTF